MSSIKIVPGGTGGKESNASVTLFADDWFCKSQQYSV